MLEPLKWGRAVLVAVCLVLGFIFGTLVPLALTAPDPVAIKTQGPDTAGNPVFTQAQPPGATGSTQTAITSSSTGAAAAITATLTGVAAKTTYITGFDVTGNGATAAGAITVTVTGTITGTLSYVIEVPVLAGNPPVHLAVAFTTPIPASGVNTNIVVNVPSFGAGNTNAAVAAYGFQQ